jgi:hypothetical protein
MIYPPATGQSEERGDGCDGKAGSRCCLSSSSGEGETTNARGGSERSIGRAALLLSTTELGRGCDPQSIGPDTAFSVIDAEICCTQNGLLSLFLRQQSLLFYFLRLILFVILIVRIVIKAK